MENRFGIKDFFLFALIGLLLVIMVLAMLQYDRQWKVIQRLEEQNQTLAGDLNRISRRIDAGSGAAGAGGPQIVQNFFGVGGSPGEMPQAMQEAIAQAGRNNPGAAAGATTRPAGGPPTGAATDPFAQLDAAMENDDFARGGWYVDNFGTKIGRLTPLVSSDVYQTWIELLVMESMAQRDPYTLEFVPKLAREWEISEDGLTMTFTLRDGITFSDGQPLTAEDVKFTFDWINNEEVQAERTRSYLTKLESVEVLDSLTVRFTFNEPYFLNFETVAGQTILSQEFYSKYRPTEFNESIGLLIGSGQYMLQSATGWTPDQDVILVRNPRYWGEPGTFDRMVFKQITEEAAESVMYKNQELDVFRTTPELYQRLQRDPSVMEFSNAYNYDTPFGGYTYIGWNQEKRVGGTPQKTIFADPKVRRAMTMMVDRQRLADELYFGYASVADGPFAPTSPQSNPEIDPWPYDVAAARELLAEVGWQDRNGDGVLENEQGQPLRFKLMYPGGSELSDKIALFLRDNFAAGGVLMEPERTDWPVLVDKLNKSDFEAATLGWSGSVETDPYQIFHSDQAITGGDNRTGYRSERLDAAIEAARRTTDTPERMKLWHEVHAILHEDQPYTFLLNRQALRLFNQRIRNVEESPLGLNYEFLNGGVLPWYIPKAMQSRGQ